MPQGTRPGAILPAQPASAGAAEALWQRLAPQRWPLPIEALPADAALVGGAVRDGLLDRLPEQPDLDLVVADDAIALARQLARRLGGSCVVLDRERSIARLVLRGWTVDLARRCGADLAADLRRRDYTVNAIALPLQPGTPLVDPTGGLADLERRELVAVSEANLLEDPLRLLRGLRLAAELDFQLSPTTALWLERHRHQLAKVAGERVLGELEKLAAAPAGAAAMAEVIRLELLRPWGGEATASGPLLALDREAPFRRGFSAEESAWALPLARLSRVLGPEVVERLHGSRRLQQQCGRLRRWQSVLESAGSLEALAEAPRLQLQQELEAVLPALLLSLPAEAAGACLRRWRDPGDPLFHPRPPIDGRRLQEALGIPGGPQLGQLLAHLTLERAQGRLPRAAEGSQEEAEVLNRAREWWDARTSRPGEDRRRD